MTIMDLFDLTGKTVLITGGAGHLGTAMSRALAAYHAHVFIASRDGKKCRHLADSLSKEYGTDCSGISLDVSSENSIQSCINCILEKTGRIDVLVNNAAFSPAGYFEEITEDTWKEGIDGTVNSAFRMCSAAIPHMVRQGRGNVINISSMYGKVSPNPEVYRGEIRLNSPVCYGVGKAAILQLTRYIAGYYGEKGIRCNSITPGPFPSKTVQETEWFIENLSKKTMLKRIGRPEDLCGALLLLASDASGYITGADICVDGGWTAW